MAPSRRPVAGRLDRRITFLVRATAQEGTYGTRKSTWTSGASVAARIEDDVPARGETTADDLVLGRRTCRIEIRHRAGVTSDMRLTIAGRAGEWRIITAPAELGRRETLVFRAEQLTTEGEEP